MFEPLIKNLVRKLDIAAEAYLERQQIINLLAVPGTLLFLLLFWAFSGAGGFVLVLGLFVVAIEVGIAVGLFLLKDKYEGQVLEWAGAADAIEGHLTGGDVFGEWTEFLQNPSTDPELEQIRAMCQALPDQYPPKEIGEYCGPDGIALMHESIERLRVGIVSKAYQDITVWWDARQEARHGLDGPVRKKKKKKKKGTPKFGRATAEEADAVMRVASMSGGILDRSEQERIDQEADKETVRAGKEERRDAKRAARTARKATRQASKQERKLRIRAAMMEAVEDEMVLYKDEDQQDPVPRHRSHPTQAPPRPHVDAYEEQEDEEEYEQEAHHSQISQPPPPPAPAPKRRRQRGLTEAAALQEVMRSGLTAHQYDDAQVRLTEQLGRYPKPREVLKALKSQFSKKSLKRDKKQKVKTAGHGRIPQRPMAAFRIDGGTVIQRDRSHRPAGAARTFARVVFVLGLITGAPFVAWRIPRPEAKPIMITGEVRHRILDHAPDIQHKLRTPFEELFGYKPVNLVEGERIYVNEADYRLCWPESWDAIYAGRYSVVITAEVTQLLFGGYSVARITSDERVYMPVATGTDYTLEVPSPLEQWQPARRFHRTRLHR